MTDTRIAAITAKPFDTPLHNPFVTSQATSHAARGVAIEFTLPDGRIGRGESVPVRYVTGECAETVTELVNHIAAELVGLDAAHFGRVWKQIAALTHAAPSAKCGLEMAALDAWTQIRGVALSDLWGGALDSAETDITIPIVPNAAELTELAWGLGIRVFKIKVGDTDFDADMARIEAVRQAAPEARLRVDANQAFTVESAVVFAQKLVDCGAKVDFLEQPVPRDDFDGLAQIAERSPLPIFADESIRSPADALRLAPTAVHGYNCKINKSGISGVLDIIAIAKAANKKLMLGCMLETRRSIAVSLALACGTGAFDYLDLDSHLLLNEPGENPFFEQEGGRIIVRKDE